MNLIPPYVRPQVDGVCLAVKLQPRAAANQIMGPHGEELRIRVTSAPVNNAANEALIELLARQLGCARRHIEVIRGHTSRHKVVRIQNLPVPLIVDRITAITSADSPLADGT
jgi:uncharacterized protein